MAGYDKSRFVGHSDAELAELTCMICLGVLCDPIETKCCRKAFCKECINNWLIKNNSCPNDRKKLTKNELIAGSKITQSLVEKLRTRCDHFESGCQEVLALESLPKHRQECRYNNSCANCGDTMGTVGDHNCARVLKQRVAQLENTVNQLNGNLVRANRLNGNLIAVLKKYSIRACFKCGVEGHDANGCPTSAGSSGRGSHRGGGRGGNRGGEQSGRGTRGAGRGQRKARGGKCCNDKVEEEYDDNSDDGEDRWRTAFEAVMKVRDAAVKFNIL